MPIKNPETKAEFVKRLKSEFPYVWEPSGDDDSSWLSADVGSNDENVLNVRFSYEYLHNDRSRIYKVHASAYSPYKSGMKIFDVTTDFDNLKKFAVDIFKRKNDEEMEKRKNSMKSELESMKLCGFLKRNEIEYTCTKDDAKSIINIFGTAFDKIIIQVFKSKPDVYVSVLPNASFDEAQVQKFILTCKELKPKP